MNSEHVILHAALDLARQGYRVLPVEPRGKRPILADWPNKATTDEATIRAWWRETPGANVGIATGSASGVEVVDEDRAGALARFNVPVTVEAKTPKGRHVYFKTNGAPLKNRVRALDGVDVRSDGGFVVAAPSLSADGTPYTWTRSPGTVPVAEMPSALRSALAGVPKPAPAVSPRASSHAGRVADAYARRALDDEAASVRYAPEGQRNATLNAAAFSLGQLVGGGVLERVTVEDALIDAALAAGLGLGETRATLDSGLAAGIAQPRTPEPKPPRPGVTHELAEPTYLREDYDGPEDEAAPVEAAEAETKPEAEPEIEDDETPALPESLWRPGFAEFRAAWGHTTESPDAFLWSAYFVATGAVLGRGPSLALGVDVRANVYVANLGRSGGARKSTGQAKADRLLANVDEGVTVLHGIGSPEGLIEALADDVGRSSRVLVNLGELSTLLRKGAQEATRGLGPLLCTLFDCPPSVSLPNRKKPLEARDPYLCIIGSTTTDWLRADLTVDDVRGGTAGRYCYFVGRPKAPIPLPPPPDARALSDAETILRAARDRAGVPRAYDLDPEAVEMFSAWYIAERAREYPTAILDTLAQRLHVFAWKAALMFAVLEGTETITGAQMAAALAFADFQRATQAGVFHGFGESPAARCAERILAALHKHGPQAGWELAQRVRHVEPETLARAIQTLARSGRIEERKDGRKRVFAALGRQGGKGVGKVSGKGDSS